MKKLITMVLILGFVLVGVSAQTADAQYNVGSLTAQQKLKEISLSKMEDAGFWYGKFPADYGFMRLRQFTGAPEAKEAITYEEQFGIGETDKNVLGAKVSFFHRGGGIDFNIMALRPLPVEGIAKVVSVWVAGRNTEHEMELILLDKDGNRKFIPMGKLNFYGWQKLSVTIPPYIKQRDYHYNDRTGIFIEGFQIKCNIDETAGRFYIYFDDLRVITDLYSEELRQVDDMTDTW